VRGEEWDKLEEEGGQQQRRQGGPGRDGGK